MYKASRVQIFKIEYTFSSIMLFIKTAYTICSSYSTVSSTISKCRKTEPVKSIKFALSSSTLNISNLAQNSSVQKQQNLSIAYVPTQFAQKQFISLLTKLNPRAGVEIPIPTIQHQ